MRESPTANAMRIVERDLGRAQRQVRQLVNVVIEAADCIREHDGQYALELKTRAWMIALAASNEVDRDATA
jgi:hypothetical protein